MAALKKLTFDDLPNNYKTAEKDKYKHINTMSSIGLDENSPELLYARKLLAKTDNTFTQNNEPARRMAAYLKSESGQRYMPTTKELSRLRAEYSAYKMKIKEKGFDPEQISDSDFLKLDSLSVAPSTIGTRSSLLDRIAQQTEDPKRYYILLTKLAEESERQLIKGKLSKDEYDETIQEINNRMKNISVQKDLTTTPIRTSNLTIKRPERKPRGFNKIVSRP